MKPAAVDINSGFPRLAELRWRRQQLSERRLRLRREQATAFSPAIAATVGALGSELRALEDEERALRSRIRFGSREAILRRAQLEQRLLQELEVHEQASYSRRILDRSRARIGAAVGSDTDALHGHAAFQAGA